MTEKLKGMTSEIHLAINPKPGERKHYLLIVQGRNAGQSIPIGCDTMTLGRSPESNIIIEDSKTSAQHCKITLFADGKIIIEDTNSTNGCFIDEIRITVASELPIGSTLLVGRTMLRHLFINENELKHDEEVYYKATTDELTGTPNRYSFMQRAADELNYAMRNGTPLSLIMADADHFKQINDRHGHLAGDEALRQLGKVFLREKRDGDLLARYGGEEFIFLLRNTPGQEAREFAERLRSKVEALQIVSANVEFAITISLGISSVTKGKHCYLEELIHYTDEALYLAKGKGRNRIYFHD